MRASRTPTCWIARGVSDYGIALGGPIRIPKVYNGGIGRFFYFKWEQFLEKRFISHLDHDGASRRQYRAGDFGASERQCRRRSILATAAGNFLDPLGRTVPVSQIFDPTTQRPVTCAVSTFTPTCFATGSNRKLHPDARCLRSET